MSSSPLDLAVVRNKKATKRLPMAASILLLDAMLLVFVYKFDLSGLVSAPVDSNLCLSVTGSKALCITLSRLPGLILILAIIGGFAWLISRGRFSIPAFSEKVSSFQQPHTWLVVHVIGLVLIVLPYFAAQSGLSGRALSVVGMTSWLIGCLAFGSGLVLWLLPAKEVRQGLNCKMIAAFLLLCALPYLEFAVGSKLWLDSFLQDATVRLSATLLRLFGQPVIWDGGYILGIEQFVAYIESSCAGLAGIIFSSGAMMAYVLWMRSSLNVPRALALVPLIALLSWSLNALRIAVLLMIGEHVSPELAVEGFHSYAGWISFTVLTGTLVFAVDRIAWFQKPGTLPSSTSRPPVFADPISAQILPFTVFIFSSLIVGAFFETPSFGYPYRVLLTLVVLLAFAKCLPLSMSWKADPLVFPAGLSVAMMWLFAQSGEAVTLEETLPGVTGVGLAAWVIVRLFGTAVIVPLVEELFFRGYLLQRLDFGFRHGKLIALLISSVLFASLHSSFLLAFLAGLVFGGLVLRSGRLWNAIVAHAIANGIIGFYALLANNWSVL